MVFSQISHLILIPNNSLLISVTYMMLFLVRSRQWGVIRANFSLHYCVFGEIDYDLLSNIFHHAVSGLSCAGRCSHQQKIDSCKKWQTSANWVGGYETWGL